MQRLIRLSSMGAALAVVSSLLMPASLARGAGASFAGSAFLEHVRYLASDRLEGRGLGSKGIDLAADYIAAQFKAAGVEPVGDDGSYFQRFEATLRRELSGESSLQFEGVTDVGALKLNEDFAPLSFSGAGRFAGPVLFVGYGITAPEFNYDDYKEIDATDKVLLVFRYEPYDENPQAKFGGGVFSHHAYHRTKVALAKEKGAAAMLVVSPPLHRKEPDELPDFIAGNTQENYGFPVVQITQALANKLLAAGGPDNLESLQKQLDEQRACLSRPLQGIAARGEVKITRVRAPARNLVGLVRGEGALASEYVVIGAHYDHLGRARYALPRNEAEREDETMHVHNGADDNASGTAGLIELARAIAAGAPPKRSVLFVAFSGEETGVLGSEYFVAHSPVPIDRMVAMLNMDMIGGLRDEKLTVFGVGTGKEFPELLERVASSNGLKVTSDQGGIGPSDQTPFYAAGVPALHFFTGSHDRYHRPEDDAEYVNAEGAARVLGLIQDLAVQLASADGRPTYQQVKQPTARAGMPRVRMGIMPSYADDDEPGMRIMGVRGGGPAEKAGLAAGDTILLIGATPIDNIYDYMGALSRYNPGDTVELTIRREGRELRFPLKLAGSR